MDQMKRKLSFSSSSEAKINIFRNELDRSIPCIENLSNEFFYEIFDYLDGCHLYEAFSNLNSRFQQLLNCSALLFKIQLYKSTSGEIFLNHYKQMILHHSHKIISIHPLVTIDDDQMILSFHIGSSFLHLQSLILKSVVPERLRLLLPKLTSLPRFSSLTIDIENTLQELNDIYHLIFQLPKLKFLKFSATESENSNITVSLPIATHQQISPIEYLIIDHPCTFDEFSTLLSYTPRLDHLNFIEISNNDLNMEILSPMTLANLTSISIESYYIVFHELEILLPKLPKELKVFSFTTYSEDMSYLQADRWKELISKYLPNLDKFSLHYSFCYDKDSEPHLYTGDVNQFIAPFWIERQCVYEIEIDLDEIMYSIRPYKKRWYNDNMPNNVINSSTEFWKSSRLTLTFNHIEENIYLLHRHIPHILSIVQIFHLKISEEVSLDTLVVLFISLTHLDSLDISSLSSSHAEDFSNEKEAVWNYLTHNNRITKIYLQKLNGIEELYSLIRLCPRTVYLKTDYINHTDMESFLPNLLQNIPEHLRLLCFRLPAADDDNIDQFDQMISSKNLLFAYTIRRVLDNIYLQWK